MKRQSFFYKVTSIQTWNNNKEQLISSHKTQSAAGKAKLDYEKYQGFAKTKNLYRIDVIEN